MKEKNGYDVLKLVMHNNRCYVSTDYVMGKPLIYWLKYHPDIPKELLYNWIREIIQSLDNFHQSQGNPSYQYVNPYSVIVSEEQKLFLLDVGSRKHDDMLHLMRRRYVREHFLSPDNQYYQKVSMREDIYGLGKTLQYIMASVEVVPPLSRWEERRFQKIISKCLSQTSKKSYQSIREISEHFPKRKEKVKIFKKLNKVKSWLYAGSLCLLFLVNIVLLQKLQKKPVVAGKVYASPKIIETQVEVDKAALEEADKELLVELFRVLEEKIKEEPDETIYTSLLEGYKLVHEEAILEDEIRLYIALIRVWCDSEELEQQECEALIQEILDKTPELLENDTLKKVLDEYDIAIEEGKVKFIQAQTEQASETLIQETQEQQNVLAEP